MLSVLLFSMMTSVAGKAQNTQPEKKIYSTHKKANMENTNGTAITLGGNSIHTVGKLPAVGTKIKDFDLTGVDLHEKTLSDFKGKYIVTTRVISADLAV